MEDINKLSQLSCNNKYNIYICNSVALMAIPNIETPINKKQGDD